MVGSRVGPKTIIEDSHVEGRGLAESRIWLQSGTGKRASVKAVINPVTEKCCEQLLIGKVRQNFTKRQVTM